MQLTVSDLSPFYLAEARSNMDVSQAAALGGAWPGMRALTCRLGRPGPDPWLPVPSLPPLNPPLKTVLEEAAGA